MFCTDCGNLLEPSKGIKDAVLKCECCGTENKGMHAPAIAFINAKKADTASKTITTSTKASSFPSLLRQKRSAIQTIERSDMKNEAVISVTCPECGRKEVRYSAVQLRSADEGSTIFYSCDCGNKYVTVLVFLYLFADIRKVEYKQLRRKSFASPYCIRCLELKVAQICVVMLLCQAQAL